MIKFLLTSVFFICSLVFSFAQMLPISDQELVETSDDIIRGKVVATHSQWVNNGKYIYTFNKIVVYENLQGNHQQGDTLVIVTPGGYDPETDMGMVVSHQAKFEVGDESVLYLVKAEGVRDAIDYSFLKSEKGLPPGILRMNGHFQGKHTIFTNENGERMLLKPNENRVVRLSDNKRMIEAIKRIEK